MNEQISSSTEVSEIKMSSHARRFFKRIFVKTLGDLAKYTTKQISGFKGIGDATLAELERILASAGLSFKTDPQDKESKTTRMTATTARNSFSEVLKRVQYGKERIIVTQNGKPRAVFIPVECLGELVTFEQRQNHIREAAGKEEEEIPPHHA